MIDSIPGYRKDEHFEALNLSDHSRKKQNSGGSQEQPPDVKSRGKSRPYEPKAEDLVTSPQDAASEDYNPSAYTSYGERGTTASVNNHGSLIQMTRYLKVGRSGFFSVDQEEIPGPDQIERRAEELMNISGTDGSGITFHFQKPANYLVLQAYENRWRREFVCDRWPRFTSALAGSNGRSSLTISSQHFVSRDDIYFQHLHYETSLAEGVQIVDCTDWFISLDWYQIRDLDYTVTDSYCEFNRAEHAYILGPHGRSVILANKHSVKGPDKHGKVDGFIGLKVAISINGQIQELEEYEDFSPGSFRLKSNTGSKIYSATSQDPLDIIIAFRLQWMRRNISREELLISDAEFQNFNDDLQNASELYSKIDFCSEPHLDFITRRNLEHILSVCSVPVDTGRTALTCGDMSGHLLVASASL